jgi:hypothetical protein
MTSGYGTRMIQTTLAASPRRGVVLVTKATGRHRDRARRGHGGSARLAARTILPGNRLLAGAVMLNVRDA